MPRFPSESNPASLHYIPAHRALRELRKQTGLSFARATFYRWLADGTIPARKLVTRWWVAAEDIAHFAQESFNP